MRMLKYSLVIFNNILFRTTLLKYSAYKINGFPSAVGIFFMAFFVHNFPCPQEIWINRFMSQWQQTDFSRRNVGRNVNCSYSYLSFTLWKKKITIGLQCITNAKSTQQGNYVLVVLKSSVDPSTFLTCIFPRFL